MSVGRPRWTWRSTCSTACWNWDARNTSASPDPVRGWGQCGPTPDPCTTLPQAASENATTPRGSDEPAWRQAFIAPNGVRFTRTPDRIHRERMPEANKAGVSEGEDHPIASGMSFGQPDCGSDPEAPALSSAQPDLNCLAPTGVTDHLSFWFQDRYQVQQCAALGPLILLAPSIDEADGVEADPNLMGAAEAVPVEVLEPDEAADIDLGYLRLYDTALLPKDLLSEKSGSAGAVSRAQPTVHEPELACPELACPELACPELAC